MAPKSKGKAKAAAAAAAQDRPKTLSSRVREVAAQQQEQQQQQNPDAGEEEPQELVLPVQLAFTSLLSATSWALRHTSAFCIVESPCAAAALWRDSFTVSLESGWMDPPLHQYLCPQDARLPAEQLLVQFWRADRFKERLQLGYRLLREHNDVTGAATLLFDIAPASNAKDWATRIQLACAAYKHAWYSRGDQPLQPLKVQEGGLRLQDVRWMRAQWLLARTLCEALLKSNRRTSGLLAMVIASLLGLASEDPLGCRFMAQRSLAGCSAWEKLEQVTRPSSSSSSSTAPQHADIPFTTHTRTFGLDTATMATAYNRFLACYHVFGFEDDETNAALEAAFALDPGRWVPLLLAGGALGAPGRSARVALGSKEEATAYVIEFGKCWWSGVFAEISMTDLMDGEEDVAYPETVEWLLSEAGYSHLHDADVGSSQMGTLLCNLGFVDNAMGLASPLVVEEMNVRLNGSMSVGTAASTRPEEAPSIVRGCLTLLCCLAAATHNLPPLETTDNRLWASVALMFGIRSMTRDPVGAVASLRGRVSDSATSIFDIAHRLVAQCRVWDQQERAGELQGSLALLWPREVLHWARTLQELRPVRARLYWQAGQVRAAKDVAAELLEDQRQLHARIKSQFSSVKLPAARDAALAALLQHGSGSPHTAAGPVLFSLPALQQLQEFLNQQAVEAARRSLSSRSRGGSSSGSSRAGGVDGPPVQYLRYEEASPESLQCFTAAVLDAAGGEASINAALDVARLLTAVRDSDGGGGNDGSESEADASSDAASEDDDDTYGEEGNGGSRGQRAGHREVQAAITVLNALLAAPVSPALPAAAPAGSGSGQSRKGGGAAAAQQALQLRQAASSSSSGEPSIIALMRAAVQSQDADWLTVMGQSARAASRHGQGCRCCGPRLVEEAVRAALADPGVVRAAVCQMLQDRLGHPVDPAEVDDIIQRAMGGLSSAAAAIDGGSDAGGSDAGGSDAGGSDASSSGGGSSSGVAHMPGVPLGGMPGMPLGSRALPAAGVNASGSGGQQQPGTAAGAGSKSAGGTEPHNWVTPGHWHPVSSIQEQAKAQTAAGGESRGRTGMLLARAADVAGVGALAAAPEPGFVFGSNPDAAAASAAAAFDYVLQSYTAPARQPAQQSAAAAGGALAAGSSSRAGQQAAGAGSSTAAAGAATPQQQAVKGPAAVAGAGTQASGTSAAAGVNAASSSPGGQPAQAAAAAAAAAPQDLKICACCLGEFPKLYRCSNCAAVGIQVGYCSQSCQKAHWGGKAGHKQVCGKRLTSF